MTNKLQILALVQLSVIAPMQFWICLSLAVKFGSGLIGLNCLEDRCVMSPKKSTKEFQITILFQSRPFSENFDKRLNIVIFILSAVKRVFFVHEKVM
jgi:hypothetical protein